MHFIIVEMKYVSIHIITNVFQVNKFDLYTHRTHVNLTVFLLAKYSVYVPHLPPGSVRDLMNLRSSSMNDMMPSQIPENTTYQSTIDQHHSPPSFQLSPGSISSQGNVTEKTKKSLLSQQKIFRFTSFSCNKSESSRRKCHGS